MPEEKEWTVMVFHAGDNNLSEEMLFSLKEMKRAGANPQVNLIALFDPNEPGVPTQRFVLNTHAENPPDGLLINDLRLDVTGFPPFAGELNAGDPQVIADFIRAGIKFFPARHYMVVLSGHGPGDVDNGFLMTDEHPFKEGDPSRPQQDALTLAELMDIFVKLKADLAKDGLAVGQPGVKAKIDILGIDCCLISSAEVCLQLSEHVDLLVGPQGFEPNLGWPYQEVLSQLMRNPALTPEEMAVGIVDEYARYYFDYVLAGRSVDMSVCNLRNAAPLTQAIQTLAETLLKALPDPPPADTPDVNNAALNALILAHWESQGYKFDQFADLFDFCDRLEQRCQGADDLSGDIRTACQGVKNVLSGGGPAERFVMKCCTSGRTFQYSNGLSIFLPWALPASLEYADLKLAQETSWDTLINRYVANSRRSARPGVASPPLPPGFDSPTKNRDSPTKNRGSDMPGPMKNPPLLWKMSRALFDLFNPGGGQAGGGAAGPAEED
ncbi:MAG: hypothetical protein JOZ02_17540 [Acidobacteria bacterium]|nr:hypothetical protein [Acidobacteriota bacterium]